jgi:hypothetical protein
MEAKTALTIGLTVSIITIEIVCNLNFFSDVCIALFVKAGRSKLPNNFI